MKGLVIPLVACLLVGAAISMSLLDSEESGQTRTSSLSGNISSNYTVFKNGTTICAETSVPGGKDFTGVAGVEDAKVIQQAIDTLGYNGGTVELMGNTTYWLENQLTWKCDLVGQDWQTILCWDNTGYAIKLYDGGILRGWSRLANFQIALGPHATGGVQLADNVCYNDLDRLRIIGSGTGSRQIGISLDGGFSGHCYWNRISYPLIAYCGTGIKFTTTANENQIIAPVIRYPQLYGIDIDSGTGQKVIGGRIEGNVANADGIRVNDDFCEFHGVNFELTAVNEDGYIITAAADQTNIFGGYFNTLGAPVVDGGNKTRIFHMNFQSAGAATIAKGTSSCVVLHELIATPTIVTLGGQHLEVARLYYDDLGPRQFTVHAADGNVTADRTITWYAEFQP
jgi:hypothetical protein